MPTPTAENTPPTTAPDGGGQRSPFTTKWFIVSATTIGLVLLALLWLIFFPAPEPDAPAPGGPAPSAPQVEGPVDSICGLRATSHTPPRVTPTADWRLVGGMAAPAGDGVGPCNGLAHGELPTGYAPDAMGALFAAYNFYAVTSDVELRLPAAEELTAPGVGRDAAIADLRDRTGGGSSGIQVVGFQFIGYSPGASAAIDLALTDGRGGYARVAVSLLWIGGDWKVDLPVSGSPFEGVQVLPNLARYVSFAGS